MSAPTSSSDLIAQAQKCSRAIPAAEALRLQRSGAALFIDVRDGLERQSKARIPGSIHADRGMLEFYLDPQSEFHKPVFRCGQMLIFVCGSGGRAALAAKTAGEMGVAACYLEGGVKAWTAAGGAAE